MFKKILFFVLSLFYVNAFFVSLSVVAQNSISTNSNSDVSKDNSQKINSSSSNSATKKSEEKTVKVENKSKEENENANKNKYLPPADINSLTKKATAPEKKAEKKLEVNQKEAALNGNMQRSPESQPENKVIKNQDNKAAKRLKENSEKRSVNEEKDEVSSKEVPDDLPDVDANEVNLPQVVAKSDDEKPNNNILFTIAAWCLIAIGVLAFIFIVLNGKYRRAKNNEDAGGVIKGKRKWQKNSKLLPDKFYKE